MRRFLLHVLPAAFTASATTGCSPTQPARPTSRPLARCCISRHRHLPSEPGVGGADHAFPQAHLRVPTLRRTRCSSSRPSLALSTSVDRRSRSRHDQQPFNRHSFASGIFSNHAVAYARGRVLQNALASPPKSPPQRSMPLRPWHTSESRCSRDRNNYNHIRYCRRSNPHSPAHPLTLAVSLRGFLPWGLSNAHPSDPSGPGRLAHWGGHRTILNNSCRSTPNNYGHKADV